MNRSHALLAALAACAAGAFAQQPAPPSPAFAAPNLSPRGVAAMAANCAICHGTDGRAVPGSGMARLAGRPADATVDALKAFKEGKREATVMHQIARGFTDPEIAALASYFARQKPEGGS